MTFIQSIILGIIQGLTEFLPISSSAHLVLVPYLFNWNFPQEQIFPFDVLVQLGTLLAVIIYFWNDLMDIIKAFFKGLVNKEPFKDPQARLGWYLIIASIPAGILGVTIKSQVEAVFASPTITALLLFGTAALLVISDLVSKRNRTQEDMTWVDALWIGAFQGLSLFPGISRSGSTITGGMTRNFDRSTSARFSFLMSIPVMLGAGLVSVKDLTDVPNLSSFLPILAAGFVVAAIVGYLSIHWLLSFIKRQKFWVFAVYCVVFASLVLLVGAIRSGNASAASVEPTAGITTTVAQPTMIEGTAQAAATPSGELQTINLEYTPSLTWLEPAISTCADALEDVHLITHLVPTDQLDTTSSDVVLRWGAPTQLDLYSAQLSTDRLAFIVSPKNPLKSLDLDNLKNVLNGKYKSWGDLYTACPDCFSTGYDAAAYKDKPLSLGFYSPNEDIQVMLDLAVMGGQAVNSTEAALLPDTTAMMETVAESDTAFGFVPERALNETVKEVPLSDVDPIKLTQPLLAIAKTEPSGAMRNWLICLQTVLNPK
jgi:undecaprenyl-diphosphatase